MTNAEMLLLMLTIWVSPAIGPIQRHIGAWLLGGLAISYIFAEKLL